MRNSTVLSILLWSSVLRGAELKDLPLCGTFPGRSGLELAKHAYISERNLRGVGPRALLAPRLEVEGDLVLMTDDGSLVSEANPFDLRNRTLIFSRAGDAGYVYRTDGSPVQPGVGNRISIADDATRVFDLSFDFPFFGGRHRRLFLNSDGNLTFGEGDGASTERSLARFLTGPPRIALFFDDLDPSETGTVRVLNVPDRFMVTWDAVPEFGKEEPNTFQVEITPDGTVFMRYGAVVSAARGIVGISPGGDRPVTLVDFSGEARELRNAIAEQFQREAAVDNVAVARSFYRELRDAYDSLVVWTNFESDLNDAFAYSVAVRNDVTGIGDEVYDRSALWGSGGELETFVVMGDLHRYPRAPQNRVLGAAAAPTSLGLLAHEIGHRFLARAQVVHPGVASDAILGRQNSHWSFFLDTDASFLEGNDIEQQSERTFRTVATVSRYSRLDLYLMGLGDASEVAPFFVVTSATASLFGEALDNESAPRAGVTITGTRTNLTIEEVIRALGERRPRAEDAPTTFRHAWVLVTRRDQPPTSEEIAQLQDARNAFIAFFNEQTLGRGHLETAIRR